MHKFIYVMLISFLFISCGDSPQTGISNNPNFIKGKIYYSDDKPVDNALVSASSLYDTSYSYTDSFGVFELNLEEDVVYSLDVSLNGYIIYSTENISLETECDSLVFHTEKDSLFYADSLNVPDNETDSIIQLPQFEYDTSYYSPGVSDFTDIGVSSFRDDISDSLELPQVIMNIGYDNENNIDYKILCKTHNMPSDLKKAILVFTINDAEGFLKQDTIRAYRVLKNWNEIDMLTTYGSITSWRNSNVRFKDIEVAETPFYEMAIKRVSSGETISIDLTSLIGSNADYGFVVTFAVSEEKSKNMICINSIQGAEPPFLIYLR